MNQPVVIERTFNAPVSKVWKAITDKNEMKEWYFDLDAFKPEVGFKFQFMGSKDADTHFLHLCEITEVIPQKKLSYSWRYDGLPGKSFVTFELFEKGEQTLLKLTHAGLETFPSTNPDFAKENFVEGWTHIVNVSLKNYLEPTIAK
ncbi:MAG: SRPBCC domain-containing protein [Ginsengibacter sp.]